MRGRFAFTLVELSVTMAAGSALMITAIGMLHQSMSLASAARQRSDCQRTLNRLANDFRSDVHRAEKCVVTPGGGIQLVMPDDSEVTYTAKGDRVRRIEPLGDGRVHHDSFDCGANAGVTFQALAQPDRALLTITRLPHLSIKHTRVDRHVAAVVGRLTAHENGEVMP